MIPAPCLRYPASMFNQDLLVKLLSPLTIRSSYQIAPLAVKTHHHCCGYTLLTSKLLTVRLTVRQ